MLPLLHHKLTLTALADPLDLLSLSLIRSEQHNVINFGYSRKLMYEDMTDTLTTIESLRRFDASFFTFLATKYCWVDLNRKWEMDLTDKTQQRYYHAWYYQDNVRFTTRILQPLAATLAGREWAEQLFAHTWLEPKEELALWQSREITYFQLLYSNHNQIGVQESVKIINALGQDKVLTIKDVPSSQRGTAAWFTAVLTGTFEFDLQGAGFNQSLVRNTQNFYGDANPEQIQAFLVGLHHSPPHRALYKTVGILTNIRTRWISPPAQLVASIERFQSLVLSNLQTNIRFSEAFAQIPTSSVLHPVPPQWQLPNFQFYGGSPICGHGRPLSFVQESFSFDDVCSSQLPLSFTWKPMNGLFAIIVRNVSSINYICLPTDVLCYNNVQPTLSSAKLLSLPALVLPSLPWNLSIMQYVATINNLTEVTIELQHLLDPQWLPFGLLSIYDWVMNEREVVSFEGDIGTLYLMSAAYQPTKQAIEQADTSLGTYLWRTSAITSIVLVLLAILTIFTGMHEPSYSWFYFNRVASSVYLSRSILAARALVASICLSTTNIVPTIIGGTLQLTTQKRSLCESCLFAGESLWFYYVFQELVYPITHWGILCSYGSVVLWIVIAVLDVFSPPIVQATLTRTCVDYNMDLMMYCQSGEIQIGFLGRLYTIFGVQLGWVVLTLLIHHRLNCYDNRSLLVPPTALARIKSTQIVKLDSITALMCGLLQLPDTVFDMTLWLALPSNLYAYDKQQKSIHLPNTSDGLEGRTICWIIPIVDNGPILTKSKWLRCRWLSWDVLYLVFGFFYLSCTLMGNVFYLNIAQHNMANDYFWAGFNTTGGYTFLANFFNHQLVISSNQNIALDSNTYIDYNQQYNDDVSTIYWPASAARQALHDPNVSTIANVISGFASYGFLSITMDVYTIFLRERRCQNILNNGAVYLEAGLRNIHDWKVLEYCWGSSFQVGITNELQKSTQGQAWLQATQTNVNSVFDEVLYWQSHHILKLDLQWQNYKTIGFTDTFLIQNALGFMHSLLLSQITPSFHPTHQTSMLMYWSFASDLWAVSTNTSLIHGMSLIRSSPNFAFSNITSESLLVQNLTLASPLPAGFTSLKSQLGPFNAIDMEFLLCPKMMYQQFLNAISTLTLSSLDVQKEFLALPEKYYVLDVPFSWLQESDTLSKGGNIFCGNDDVRGPMYYGFDVGFSDTNFCNAFVIDDMQPSIAQFLYAFFSFDATMVLKTGDIDIICKSDIMIDGTCNKNYAILVNFLKDHEISFASLTDIAKAVHSAVFNLNVVMVQYKLNTTSNHVNLDHINLFDKRDRAWHYYGWLILFEWVSGAREVIAFNGDAGTIATISQRTIPATLTPTSISKSFAIYFQICGLYITITLLAVSAVVVTYAVIARGRIQGLNILKMNRVVGIAWIGRMLLVVRSIIALCLLHTSTLQLVQIGDGTKFMSPPLSWYKCFLASAESTWLVYVLNDLMSCVTQQYTRKYASKSSILAWGVTFFWTYFSPQIYSAHIDRQCSYIDMDSGLSCVSGLIQIGSLNRVLISFGIGFGCIILCYTIEYLMAPNLTDEPITTLYLNSQAYYALELVKVDGKIHLDRASAAMAGMLSISWRQKFYILDTKSWRFLTIPIPNFDDETLWFNSQQCLPLNR
ncbi:hypothetical protein THRCLA_11719 [Thraustotheca clavata]|uniref:Uncharacterized protein n=1 Tax=Thraustotheca clavata TaxID=74557 RepID=A0A1V9Y6V7_9STRA|nr:hypothetical protein THRCLA_11719 [Thraustotheca clavata]